MFRGFSTASPLLQGAGHAHVWLISVYYHTPGWEIEINGKIVLSINVHHPRECIWEALADSASMVCSQRLGVSTRASWGCYHHDWIFCRKACRRNGQCIPNSIRLETGKKTAKRRMQCLEQVLLSGFSQGPRCGGDGCGGSSSLCKIGTKIEVVTSNQINAGCQVCLCSQQY